MTLNQTLAIPSDGPDAALVRVARSLKLRYTRTYVNGALLEQEQPNSLLALVKVAQAMGLKTTAARAEAESLDELSTPSILHFEAAGTEGGFGVLEKISGDGFDIWDSVNGSRTVGREALLSRWSGVVVLLDRGETRGPLERGYLPRRLFEIVAGQLQAPSLVGSQAMPALRAAVAAAFIILLALAIAGRDVDQLPSAALVALSLIGLAASVTAAVSVGDQKHPLAGRVCSRGKLIDCESVLTSKYSRFFGIPMSEVGIAFFGAMGLLVAGSALFPDYPAVWNAVGVAFTASLIPAMLLIGAQIAMRQLCTLCLTVHAVNFAGALVYWVFLRDGWMLDGVPAALLLMGLFMALIAFLVTPYFMSAARMDALGDDYGRMMRSPFASLAQLQTEPASEVSGALCGVPLGDPTAEHELVIFAHQGCTRCEPVLAQVHGLVSKGLVRAFLTIAPKDGSDSELRACATVLAAALCLPPEARLQAYAAAKKHADELRTEQAVTLLSGEMGIAPEKIEASLDGAWALIKRAHALAEELVEVTPAVFFDSRRFTGPLVHLEYLLTSHPDLVSRDRKTARVPG